jgi:hypothetical protein
MNATATLNGRTGAMVVGESEVGSLGSFALITGKKQGAAGITTAAPYIAGQWGRGEDRLPV